MSTYVIGDIQGCHGAFLELLDANQLAGSRVRTSEAKTHFAIM